MLKSFLRLVVFILAIAAVLEISLRFIYFGTDAFSLDKMNSYVLIIDSELVQPAESLDIYYELKPNLDTLFHGKRIVTNTDGLPDGEYSKDKPANVFRVAVVGSSWTMATGVDANKNYPSLLENQLLEHASGNKTEVINFAVEYYGLGELIGSVKHKALAYDPDMIIFAITTITPSILWEDHNEPFTKAETTPPFWQSHLFSTVMNLAGYSGYTKTRRSQVKNLRGGYMRQIVRSMEELGELTRDKNIRVVVIWLSYDEPSESIIRTAEKHVENHGFMFIPINLKALANEQQLNDQLLTEKLDNHPNETGHKLIADKLHKELWRQARQSPN